MKQTAAQRKVRSKRARRPIYLVVRRLVDRATGEEVGALVPANDIDARLLRERKFTTGREVRAEMKQPRNPKFHRLAHAVGFLLVENVDGYEGLSSHEAIKEVQRLSGVCCDVEKMTIDLGSLGRHEVERLIPRSIAFDEMEEDEFRQFFEGITGYIAEHYASVMLDEVRAEFWEMVQGRAA